MDNTKSNRDAAKDSYTNYAEYNKALRTWFISFGLGALVLFMLHPEFVKLLKATGNFRQVVFLFLFGCLLQVLVALMNKYSSWHMFFAYRYGRVPHTFWEWLDNAFWIDKAFDITTTILFSWSIWIMMQTFVVN